MKRLLMIINKLHKTACARCAVYVNVPSIGNQKIMQYRSKNVLVL